MSSIWLIMAVNREAIIRLYRNLIRESKKWNSYNYRMYALRKIHDEFQQNKVLQDVTQITECYNRGLESLELIKRQSTIGNFYSTQPLVIETQKSLKRDTNINIK